MRSLLNILTGKTVIPARYMGTATSWRDLQGKPGALTSYTMITSDAGPLTAYEACCPSCGVLVAALSPDIYPITGSADEGDGGTLNCDRAIHFTGCCGWRGYLRRGTWVGR